jgi:hypothetical protein
VLAQKSLLCSALALGLAATAAAQVTVSVDAGAGQHPIDPRIYGVAFADPAALDDLGATLNRWGGNTSSRYNWQQNIDNRGADWFFESLILNPNVPGQAADSFISQSRAGGAEPMLTFPMCDWIAKAGPGYTDLWSFSVAKYGPQQDTDYWRPDAGNGMVWDGQAWVPITWNDMDDANTPNSGAHQQGWFQHVVGTWGPASANGLKYWFYDNESSIWFATHRDVVRQGKHDDEYIALVKDYGARARASDPSVKLFGPEEWGWSAYFYSGYDLWYGPTTVAARPRFTDFIPYSSTSSCTSRTRGALLDGLTLHFCLGGQPATRPTSMMPEPLHALPQPELRTSPGSATSSG